MQGGILQLARRFANKAQGQFETPMFQTSPLLTNDSMSTHICSSDHVVGHAGLTLWSKVGIGQWIK